MFKLISATLFILAATACTTPQPPTAPDRSKIRPINNEASMQIIRDRVNQK